MNITEFRENWKKELKECTIVRKCKRQVLDINGKTDFQNKTVEKYLVQIQSLFLNNQWFHYMTVWEVIKALIEGIAQIILVAYLFYNSMLPILLFLPYLFFFFKKKDRESERAGIAKRKTEFKDGIVAVSFALNVGYSVENAFKEAVGELKLLYGKDSSIVNQFQTIVKRTQCNENLEDVLADYAQHSGVEDIRYFAQVFAYGKRSGGDLISMIRNTASTISQKIEVENEIQTIISGKKMEQRVMCAVPFAILLYLRISAPEFISSLYGNVVGVIIMTVCLCIYLLSVYLAKRIVNIEV